MESLPSGTVTFLFTDIEGSTRLAQEHREQWESLRARHHEILRQAMQAHDGHVFQIIGDAFCVAFGTAVDALKAAVEAQRLLQQEAWSPAPIKVRMGIHTGTARASGEDAGDYKGYAALARAQRLMSAGHGGQVLVSRAAEELLRDELPEDLALRDMGERRLKDLDRPERIFQMVASNLPADFPPLKTLDAYRHNLPAQMTSFIGRVQEMAEVALTLSKYRLVTLTGSGGTGKTRLALQVAADVLDQFPDGVWFVELATLTDPDFIAQTVLSAFGVREQPGRSALQSLLDYLPEKNVLIVLDNCDHLVEASASLVDTLLNSAHALKIMATSREALGVKGEATWQVPSLSLPDILNLPAVEGLSQYEAVQLFFERALLVQPHFTVTEDNATVIAQICVRLDGIPLALELTAARTRFLSLGEMASRLDDRFALLTAGGRTATPRHQTLRAAIDWSYNLLSEEERLLFGRLAVFAGGWTLEAAEAVCAGEGVETGEVLDVMSRLVDKSLVVVEKAGERVRYRLLETIRQYASEKLVESGERAALSKRHLEYFVQLAERAEPELTGAKQTHWLERVQREHDNLRAALEWCQQWAEGAELGLRLAGALQFFWHLHSYYSEGRRWLENMLELPAVRRFTAARAKALYGAGSLANLQGDYMVARSRLEESIALGQELGDKEIVAYGLHHRAITAMYEGDYTLWGSLLAQSVALFRETADMWGLAFSLCSLGYSATHLSDPVAGTVLEESQALSRRLGNTWGLARVLHVSGELARAHGEDARARALYEESLALYRELGHHNTAASVLWNLGIVAQHQRDVERAAACFSEGLALHRHYGDKRNMGSCIAGLAGVVAMRGQPERAARLFGAVQAWWDTLGTHLEPVDQAEIDRNIAVVRTAVGEHAFDTLWAEGRRMTLEQAVDLALLKV